MGKINYPKYRKFLQKAFVSAVAVMYPNPKDPVIPNATIWYQQDRAPRHYALQVRRYLDATFPIRLIEMNNMKIIEWPARSTEIFGISEIKRSR